MNPSGDTTAMPEVTVRSVRHYDELVVGIYFEKDRTLIDAVRRIRGVKFSWSCRCWYVTDREGLMDEIVRACKDLAVVKYQVQLKENGDDFPLKQSDAEKSCPAEYIDLLIRKRYSEATIRNYCSQFSSFVRYAGKGSVDALTDEDIRAYLKYLVKVRKISVATQNVAINAIKFYFEKVRGGERKHHEVDRPLKEFKLPMVLSEDEVAAILKSCGNLKHRAMLYLIYASGLRRGEIISLRLSDIDYDRKLITVRGGKGRKDRITLLSEKVIGLLRRYSEEYRPKEWVFEGEGGGPYSPSSLHKVFTGVLLKSGIRKPATLHTLRHSFATHLLESGTDIRYIQALLGHNSVRTTEIYAHVTRKAFEKIRSPLDNLDL